MLSDGSTGAFCKKVPTFEDYHDRTSRKPDDRPDGLEAQASAGRFGNSDIE